MRPYSTLERWRAFLSTGASTESVWRSMKLMTVIVKSSDRISQRRRSATFDSSAPDSGVTSQSSGVSGNSTSIAIAQISAIRSYANGFWMRPTTARGLRGCGQYIAIDCDTSMRRCMLFAPDNPLSGGLPMNRPPFSRRIFIGGITLASLAPRSFAESSRPKVGCQVNGFAARTGDFSELLTVLPKIKSLGYTGFECNNHFVLSELDHPADARRRIQASGLEFIGMHTSMAEAEKNDLGKLVRGGAA